MPSYRAFGLELAADDCLPGFLPARGVTRPDIRILLGQLPPRMVLDEVTRAEPWFSSPYLDENGLSVQRMWEAPGGYFLMLCAVGIAFVIDGAGSEIWGSWPENLSLAHAGLWLRGPAMNFLLALRGFVCLHASVVVIDGRAVAFAGPAGTGKSTTAAAFVRRGFPALADDIAAIPPDGARLTILPAYPRICLWPESTAALGPGVEALPRQIPENEKRYIELRPGSGFYDEPAPLGAFYLLRPMLAGSGGPEVESLAGAEELLALLANGHEDAGLTRARSGMEFAVLGRVASQVPIRKVRVPRGRPCAEELCETILNDFRASLRQK